MFRQDTDRGEVEIASRTWRQASPLGKVMEGKIAGSPAMALVFPTVFTVFTVLTIFLCASLSTALAAAIPTPAREKNKDGVQYGAGLITNLPYNEKDVDAVLEDVIQDGIIRGSKEYNKDEYVSGATPAESTKAFAYWTEGGKVFYKIRAKAIDPRNFKDSSDVGTLAVRYIVLPQGEKNSVLRIDAVFVEDFRHVSHPSNGSVETAEFKDIHDRLEAVESMKEQTAEAEREKREYLAGKTKASDGLKQSSLGQTSSSQGDVGTSSSRPAAAEEKPEMTAENTAPSSPAASFGTPAKRESNDAMSAVAPDTPPMVASRDVPGSQPEGRTPEERLKYLKQQVERLVKAPGAALKSAPFHTASTLQSLPPGAEVLIVVSTPYWLGVETHDGQHGWILRDQLELLP